MESKIYPDTIGIDIGTSYFAAGVWNGEKVEIIPNNKGKRRTHSCIFLDEKTGLVGFDSKKHILSNSQNALFDIKKLIGRRFSENSIASEMKLWPFRVTGGPKNALLVEVKGKYFHIEELYAIMLKQIKKNAEAYLKREVNEAVISVPAHFNDSQRQATKDACAIAGLKKLRLINETSAAALSFGLNKISDVDEKKIIIFSLGKGACEVSLLYLEDGILEVKSTVSNIYLQGEDLDNRILNYCCNKLKKKYGVNISGLPLWRLKHQCEKAKKLLSFKPKSLIEVENVIEGINFSYWLTREKFEEMNIDYFKAYLQQISNILSENKLNKEQIDEVVLMGGSTKIPKIRNIIRDFFGREPTLSVDEAVVSGAAIKMATDSAYKICSHGKLNEILLIDVISASIGNETAGGVMTKIFDRNTAIPVSQKQMFTTYLSTNQTIMIQVFEGENQLTHRNHFLGKFEFEGIPPAPRGVPQIEVSFNVNRDGILSISAIDKTHSRNCPIKVIEEKGRLSPEEIEEKAKKVNNYWI